MVVLRSFSVGSYDFRTGLLSKKIFRSSASGITCAQSRICVIINSLQQNDKTCKVTFVPS